MRTGPNSFLGCYREKPGYCAITGAKSVAEEIFRVAVLGMCFRIVFSSVLFVAFLFILF